MRDKLIRLIRRLMAGLKTLLISPCLKRRIRKKGQQGLSGRPTAKLTLSMKIPPTKSEDHAILDVDDYGLEASITLR